MISYLYAVASTPIRRLLFRLASRAPVGQPQKTIQIVKLDAIGDFVLFSAILPYFRKLYPGYKIVLIVDAVVKDLALWLNEQDHFDELIVIDGKQYNRNFVYYYQTLKKIRLLRPQIVIQPTFSRTQKSDEVVLISREAKKIAYQGDVSNITPTRKAKNDTYYDRLIQNPASFLEVDRNMHFINELVGSKVAVLGSPHWQLSQNLRTSMKSKLETMGIDLATPLVAICPGSSRSVKNWPADKFITLVRQLSNKIPSLQFVLIGGPKEQELCSGIQKALQGSRVYNLCGQVTLPQLAGVLSYVKAYVGNDTGAMHLASAVGVSAIGIMSGEHGSRFFPYPSVGSGAKNIAIVNPHNTGIGNIPVEKVLREAEAILRGE